MNNNNPTNTQQEEEKSTFKISLWAALLPVFILVSLLAYNVHLYGAKDSDIDTLAGSNQFVLLIGAAVAVIIGFSYKVSFDTMLEGVADNVKSTTGAILILLFVGALSGTWLLSGVIPTMIYYGLQILSPTYFLTATVLICSIISLATGSSWSTTATIGIALMGIGNALGIPMGMTGGAVISGAYFGDKMSPLSDTTNLAPAMAGTDLFTHIRYMMYTTVPTYIITLIIFTILGFTLDTSNPADISGLLTAISDKFNISLWLFIVPIAVIVLIVKKTPPLLALFIGTFLGGLFALIFQPDMVVYSAKATTLNLRSAYQGIMNSITIDTSFPTENPELNKLFSSSGMSGMLNTIWLILCAMVFGGIMEAIGALETISKSLLNLFYSTFGLFASTVFSCIFVNATASDQYLSIVVPGKMFAKAFKDRGLAPENLSRTLEDSGTVTSALWPWNTGGAYQSTVLGVPTLSYVPYAFFNLISPFMTLIFAAFRIKIRKLKEKN
ncbi:Na+/H+ antiporter NhaC [Zhouia sp. PK063]|uniref:Na+/H+ antiporter NhaC n=1 Tax=Zhouia sp. PK063 TaxID=3373602 RepID=UPI003791AFE0